MRGAISPVGVLIIERQRRGEGTLVPVICKYAENKRSAIPANFCSDLCAHFGELLRTEVAVDKDHKKEIVLLSLCDGKELVFDSFLDNRTGKGGGDVNK